VENGKTLKKTKPPGQCRSKPARMVL